MSQSEVLCITAYGEFFTGVTPVDVKSGTHILFPVFFWEKKIRKTKTENLKMHLCNGPGNKNQKENRIKIATFYLSGNGTPQLMFFFSVFTKNIHPEQT